MCYSAEARYREKLKIALQRGDILLAEEIQRKLDEIQIEKNGQPLFFADGFSHPKLLTFTDTDPMRPQMFSWGLIPSWAKDWNSANIGRKKTLNAKLETMFDKPSFKHSAEKKRCLVYVDGFYDYHSANGKKYPFHISMKDGSPLIFAGLWSEWVNKQTGEVHNSVAVVTTEPTPGSLMARIHNEPAASETPRMPVILPKERQEEWLVKIDAKNEADIKHLMSFKEPFDNDLLSAHTVRQLKGKAGVGNSEEAIKEFIYEDLIF